MIPISAFHAEPEEGGAGDDPRGWLVNLGDPDTDEGKAAEDEPVPQIKDIDGPEELY